MLVSNAPLKALEIVDLESRIEELERNDPCAKQNDKG